MKKYQAEEVKRAKDLEDKQVKPALLMRIILLAIFSTGALPSFAEILYESPGKDWIELQAGAPGLFQIQGE